MPLLIVKLRRDPPLKIRLLAAEHVHASDRGEPSREGRDSPWRVLKHTSAPEAGGPIGDQFVPVAHEPAPIQPGERAAGASDLCETRGARQHEHQRGQPHWPPDSHGTTPFPTVASSRIQAHTPAKVSTHEVRRPTQALGHLHRRPRDGPEGRAEMHRRAHRIRPARAGRPSARRPSPACGARRAMGACSRTRAPSRGGPRGGARRGTADRRGSRRQPRSEQLLRERDADAGRPRSGAASPPRHSDQEKSGGSASRRTATSHSQSGRQRPWCSWCSATSRRWSSGASVRNRAPSSDSRARAAEELRLGPVGQIARERLARIHVRA